MSCSGKCRSSVLEPLFDTFPPLMNFSLFSLFIFRNYNLIYSVKLLFRVYRSHFCVYGGLTDFSQDIIKIISGSIAPLKGKIKSIPAFSKCC